ncbi:MAG: prolyl-tRNA synthetase associated domain-containing protein [Magnetovibrionaceae bacterium]
MTATPTDLPTSPAALLSRLEKLGIEAVTHDHPPLMTVDDSKALRGDLPGAHCKNLFLKDKKGRLFLVVAQEDRAIDLKALRKAIGAAQLSFGKPELLGEVLGITPGAVTPFSLINDTDHRVTVILDKAMIEDFDLVNYHPLTNEKTTALSPADLIRFIEACGHKPQILPL